MYLRLIFVCVLLAKSFEFYEDRSSTAFYENSNVIELFPSNFDELVLQSDHVWVVQFYAPWCYYSKQVVSEYKKLATHMKYKDVYVGAMEAYGDDPFYKLLNLKGFPTIKVFGIDKSSPIYYKGNRTAEDIADFVNELTEELTVFSEDEPKSEYDGSSLEAKIYDDWASNHLYSNSSSGSESGIKNNNKLFANSFFTMFIAYYLFNIVFIEVFIKLN